MITVESGYIFASVRQGGIKRLAIRDLKSYEDEPKLPSDHACFSCLVNQRIKEKIILYFLFIRSLKMRSYILNMLLINCLHHNLYHFVDCEPIEASMKYLA